jgi:GTP cyclohydrolase II
MYINIGVNMACIRARTKILVGKNGNISTDIISFHGLSDKKEHVALVFKDGDKQPAPLVRLHSECLTGDVFNSSRCDCGDQLHETIKRLSEQGGILLYLRQEGRGIGLYNKLDTYVLQRNGMNTYQANTHLGFEEDERDFTAAEEMLKALNVLKVSLITNNPKKIAALQQSTIQIEEIVNTGVYEKLDNQNYLHTKHAQGGHMITLSTK